MIDKMKRILKRNDIIKVLITALFIMLPVTDVLRTTFIKDVEILNISIVEFLNFLLIGIPFLLTIGKLDKKAKKWLGVCFLIFVLYMFLHIKNIYSFNIDIFTKANPNFVIEMYYIIRVYVLPILLIIVLLNNKDIFNKNYYLNVLKYLIITISGLIILTNIFRFSYSSYDDEFGLINRTNFFDIFNHNGSAKELLTCGLFNSANQISIILFMLLPLNIYNFYTKKRLSSLFLVLIQTISMIIVGTKVAAIGSILVVVATLLMYLFFVIIKKEKKNNTYLLYHIIILIITTVVILISPFTQVMLEKHDSSEPQERIDYAYSKLEEDLTDEEFVTLLKEYNGVFKIGSVFYKLYPIEKDIDFWKMVAKRDNRLNVDYRVIKNDIIKRVIERNNNVGDKLFGIGYTSNFVDIETDYLYQNYLFGIMGLIILVGVYVFIYAKNILDFFKGNNFNYRGGLKILTSFLGLAGCAFSGHLFGWVSPMIILATTLVIGRLSNND